MPVNTTIETKPLGLQLLEAALAAGTTAVVTGGRTTATPGINGNTSQGGKVTFWDKIVNGVNSVTSRIQWGSTRVDASLDQNNLYLIGAIVIGFALLWRKKR